MAGASDPAPTARSWSGRRSGPAETEPGSLPLKEESRRIGWRQGDLRIDVLPSRDLGNSSFLLLDRRAARAVVVDPTRDVTRYLDAVRQDGLRLDWVLTTHTHADFVSGAAALAERSGARVASGSPAGRGGAHRLLRPGDHLDIGSARVEPIASPGHAPDHVSYLLRDRTGTPRVLLSGGSLMAGTAGRADLGPPGGTYRAALDEFETLHRRFAPLPSGVVVLPTHVGGSFCGVGARSEARTTLGRERASNPLFLARDRAHFLAEYLSGTPFPRYYAGTRRINEDGGTPGEPAPTPGPDVAPDVPRSAPNGTVWLDVRPSSAFDGGHVPGSISIPAYGAFSGWVGWLFGREDRFLLLGDDPEELRDARIGLSRIGFDHVDTVRAGALGEYLRSGAPIAATPRVSVSEVARRVARGEALTVLDVRNPDEHELGRIPGALGRPLPDLTEASVAGLDRAVPVYVHCQSGRRAGIAASLLERWGFRSVHHVLGGPPKPRLRGRARAPRPTRRKR